MTRHACGFHKDGGPRNFAKRFPKQVIELAPSAIADRDHEHHFGRPPQHMPRASSPYADLLTSRMVLRVLPLQICTASGGSCLRSQRDSDSATALPRQLATVAPGGGVIASSRAVLRNKNPWHIMVCGPAYGQTWQPGQCDACGQRCLESPCSSFLNKAAPDCKARQSTSGRESNPVVPDLTAAGRRSRPDVLACTTAQLLRLQV